MLVYRALRDEHPTCAQFCTLVRRCGTIMSIAGIVEIVLWATILDHHDVATTSEKLSLIIPLLTILIAILGFVTAALINVYFAYLTLLCDLVLVALQVYNLVMNFIDHNHALLIVINFVVVFAKIVYAVILRKFIKAIKQEQKMKDQENPLLPTSSSSHLHLPSSHPLPSSHLPLPSSPQMEPPRNSLSVNAYA